MFLLFGATVRGQEPPAPIIVHATPSGAKLPEPLGKFTDTKPDLTLIPRGEGARGGRVWLRTVGNGLLIAGKVDGGPADFPKDQPQVLAKDHIEIWLAASPEVAMPQVGWVNYMEQTLLPEGPDSCAELYAGEPQQDEREKRCRDWAARQLRYRGYLKRLFLRQWLVAPGSSIEAFATPAYNEILQNFGGDQEIYVNDGPRLLKPRGAIQQWISGEPDGYFFQILIPFTALPPFSSLQLSDLYLMVDVFSAAPSGKKTGVYATSSPARVYGDPGTFNAVRIDPPVNYRLTPCNLPLQGLDRVEELSGNEPSHAAWFVP